MFIMDGGFGNNFVTVTDDDGNEFELEHLDTIEMDGEVYVAFYPADIDEDHESFGVVILKVIEEDNEEFFVEVIDEDELNAAFEIFAQRHNEFEE